MRLCLRALARETQDRRADRARDQLKICIRDACPTFVRNECTEWLAEVEASLPTVVLAARRGDQDLDEVRVTMDGHPIADRLTGTAIPLDPGTHVFRFELEGSPPIEQRVLVRVGEKNRRVAVSFGAETADNTLGATAEADADIRTKGLDKRTVSYALAGLGAAALGSFAFFALTGKSDENDLRDWRQPQLSRKRRRFRAHQVPRGRHLARRRHRVARRGHVVLRDVDTTVASSSSPTVTRDSSCGTAHARRRFPLFDPPLLTSTQASSIAVDARCIHRGHATHSSQVGATHRNCPSAAADPALRLTSVAADPALRLTQRCG